MVQIDVGVDRFTICNLYRFPTSNFKAFCDNILELANYIIDNSRKVILIGDFNINVAKKSHYVKKLTDGMTFAGLEQTVHEPTRSTFTSDTIIDLVFSNFELNVEVLTTPKSTDHNIILVNVAKNDRSVKSALENVLETINCLIQRGSKV